jgi:hypothetical protein
MTPLFEGGERERERDKIKLGVVVRDIMFWGVKKTIYLWV